MQEETPPNKTLAAESDLTAQLAAAKAELTAAHASAADAAAEHNKIAAAKDAERAREEVSEWTLL